MGEGPRPTDGDHSARRCRNGMAYGAASGKGPPSYAASRNAFGQDAVLSGMTKVTSPRLRGRGNRAVCHVRCVTRTAPRAPPACGRQEPAQHAPARAQAGGAEGAVPRLHLGITWASPGPCADQGEVRRPPPDPWTGRREVRRPVLHLCRRIASARAQAGRTAPVRPPGPALDGRPGPVCPLRVPYASGRTTPRICIEPAPVIVTVRPGRGACTTAPSPMYIPTWLASSK